MKALHETIKRFFQCRSNTYIIKEDMGIKINEFQTVNRKVLQFLEMRKYLRQIKYLYQKLNNISSLKTLQIVFARFSYISDEVSKTYDTEGIKLKRYKSFLNYKLVISEIFNLLERKDLLPARE